MNSKKSKSPDRHTYNYGVIGNCSYTAHIHMDTRVSWMCWPRFDSSFIFGEMVAGEKGGEFSIKPVDKKFKSTQQYIENTNILKTTIKSDDGIYNVVDFAPRFLQTDRYYKPLMLVRKIERVEGNPRIFVKCKPVGDYGNVVPQHSFGSNHIRYLGMDSHVRLTTNIPLSYIAEEQSFVLDDTKYLVMTYGPPLEAALEETVNNFYYKTLNYWRNWVKRASIVDFYQREAIRSALILKIHQFEDTGAIIAATTTSLPESPGSTRNWDYRYCWMRDTFYTLNAFNNIGHFEEVEKYFHYILNTTVDEEDRFQPLYGISGKKKLIEKELSDLPGYEGNIPVRVGNDAYTHIQNDVYGQVLISLLPLYSDMRIIFTERFDSVPLIMKTLKMIQKTFDEKDAGLWEFRNLAQHHCYTYLFHWAGSSAAIKIAKVLGNREMGELAVKLKGESEKMIEKCYVPAKKGYAQAVGVERMDASTLQLIMMNYITDPVKLGDHLKALEKELFAGNGLFYRYKHQDDFGEPETTFLICAFWYVEALACVGRVGEAINFFEQIISRSNHLGLLSEDISADDGSMWGNFPQAYSHVGLLNAATRIARKLDMPSFL